MTADISDSHANNESNLQDPSASPPRVPDHWTFLSVTIYEPTPPPIANRVEYLSRLEKNLADCPVEVQHSAAKQFHKHITRGPKPTSENAIATAAERAKRIRWKVKHGKDIGKRQTEPQLRKDLGHKLCEKERTRASYAEKLRWRRGGRVDMGKLRLWYDLTLKRSKRLGCA
ncbi:hypothetical protein EYC84_007809 [Monilinia fructicola]|uniref:Uncharacterized protein n=1 Tax=Monilinia fructicola TaxID=38448 RepID=A0A5M9JM41_MONFR|nr:hypothetical protein EYC84_007809 [Monilinia fructicola]